EPDSPGSHSRLYPGSVVADLDAAAEPRLDGEVGPALVELPDTVVVLVEHDVVVVAARVRAPVPLADGVARPIERDVADLLTVLPHVHFLRVVVHVNGHPHPLSSWERRCPGEKLARAARAGPIVRGGEAVGRVLETERQHGIGPVARAGHGPKAPPFAVLETRVAVEIAVERVDDTVLGVDARAGVRVRRDDLIAAELKPTVASVDTAFALVGTGDFVALRALAGVGVLRRDPVVLTVVAPVSVVGLRRPARVVAELEIFEPEARRLVAATRRRPAASARHASAARASSAGRTAHRGGAALGLAAVSVRGTAAAALGAAAAAREAAASVRGTALAGSASHDVRVAGAARRRSAARARLAAGARHAALARSAVVLAARRGRSRASSGRLSAGCEGAASVRARAASRSEAPASGEGSASHP